ncbi:hypothetical protein J4227_00445 [Candidatus Woesearchaeota archaeon]|nr:hypothetical protein [Candidatus Woesearchaeota archaeon]
MVKNYLIKFLVDEIQFERIKLNASAKGHKTISSYLRDVTMNKDRKIETMIVEIHNEVVKNGRARA